MMSTGIDIPERDKEALMHVADCARISREVMTYLIAEQLLGTTADIRLISVDDVVAIHEAYAETYADDPARLRTWSPITTS